MEEQHDDVARSPREHLLHDLELLFGCLNRSPNGTAEDTRRDVLLINCNSTSADDTTSEYPPRGPRTALTSWRRLFSS